MKLNLKQAREDAIREKLFARQQPEYFPTGRVRVATAKENARGERRALKYRLSIAPAELKQIKILNLGKRVNE